MITYTKERFNALCDAYLTHIETCTDPVEFMKPLMGRFWPVAPHMEAYLRLLLEDPIGRAVLGAFCVHMHYALKGRNVLIEGIGVPSLEKARQIHDTVSALALKAENLRVQRKNSEKKKANRKVNKKNAEAALIRKEIRMLNNEISQLEDQIRKKRRQVSAKLSRLADMQEWFLKYAGTDESPYAEVIVSAAARMNEWLKPLGYRVACKTESLEESKLGEYEAGSVFSKIIEITADPANIESACSEDPVHDRYSNPAVQLEVTLYHELGHAVIEQVVDWMEYNEDFKALEKGEFGTKYMDILDDYIPEEDLAEDFAWGMLDGKPSLLQRCFEEAAEQLSKV